MFFDSSLFYLNFPKMALKSRFGQKWRPISCMIFNAFSIFKNELIMNIKLNIFRRKVFQNSSIRNFFNKKFCHHYLVPNYPNKLFKSKTKRLKFWHSRFFSLPIISAWRIENFCSDLVLNKTKLKFMKTLKIFKLKFGLILLNRNTDNFYYKKLFSKTSRLASISYR